MMLPLAIAGVVGAFDWTNGNVSACVRSRDDWDANWLNTANELSYMCTREQINEAYDPANLACWQSDAQNPTGDVATGTCPAGTAVKCLIQAGWGQVAGNCDACDKQECSKTGAAGEKSCAALACTDSGNVGAAAGTSCQGNAWKSGTSPVDPTHTDGYCDCAPDCGDCDGPPGVLEGDKFGVTPSFCDVRNGTSVSTDWAGCFNSCVDCMGDDLTHQGVARYMPEAMGQQIIGSKNWTTYNVGHYNGTGSWWLCKTDNPVHAGDCTWMGLADGLPNGPKFKGLALCA